MSSITVTNFYAFVQIEESEDSIRAKREKGELTFAEFDVISRGPDCSKFKFLWIKGINCPLDVTLKLMKNLKENQQDILGKIEALVSQPTIFFHKKNENEIFKPTLEICCLTEFETDVMLFGMAQYRSPSKKSALVRRRMNALCLDKKLIQFKEIVPDKKND